MAELIRSLKNLLALKIQIPANQNLSSEAREFSLFFCRIVHGLEESTPPLPSSIVHGVDRWRVSYACNRTLVTVRGEEDSCDRACLVPSTWNLSEERKEERKKERERSRSRPPPSSLFSEQRGSTRRHDVCTHVRWRSEGVRAEGRRGAWEKRRRRRRDGSTWAAAKVTSLDVSPSQPIGDADPHRPPTSLAGTASSPIGGPSSPRMILGAGERSRVRSDLQDRSWGHRTGMLHSS